MKITVRGLTRRYGDTAVLDQLDLDVAAGECVALVGRSGAGKSTLLHLLAGIDQAEAGSIAFDGQRIDTLDEAARTAFRRRHLGLVFQNWNLVPSLSALDNLRLPLELVGVRGAAARERAQALLERLGLGELGHRFADEMSGGQQQRVAVARALVHAPSVLLADEPTGSLDAESAVAVMRLLVGACREAGASLVLVTHAAEVMGQADRLLRMDAGRLRPA
jgi:putative ABC transport system ATP-binding protein